MPQVLANGRQYYTNADGTPLVGGKVWTYDSGTNTPRVTYSDAAGTTPNTNPVILDARGEATIFWSGTYRVRLLDPNDNVIWDVSGLTTIPEGGSASDLEARLASITNVNLGAAMVGYKLNAVGSVGRLLNLKLAEWVSVNDFGADPTGVLDSTAAFAAALAAARRVYVPQGTYLADIRYEGLRDRTLFGAARGATLIKNWSAGSAIRIDNTTADCRSLSFHDFTLQNRDKAVYTTTDGIYITGNGSNENDFHAFRDIEIIDFRHNINIDKRTVFNTWVQVHAYSAINDNLRIVTDDNVSQQTFIQCRFGSAGAYGVHIGKAAGDLLANIVFLGCTSEKNNLCGLYIEGAASGVQGFLWHGCYMEENTKTIAAGTAAPRKANVWITAQSFFGEIRAGSLYGAAGGDPPLDYTGWFIEDTCVNLDFDLGGGTRMAGGTIAPFRFPTTWRGLGGAVTTGGGVPVAPTSSGGRLLGDLPARSTGSFVGTLTGVVGVAQGTFNYEVNGTSVTLEVPTILDVSNSVAGGLTGLPVALRPVTRTQSIAVRVVNNGATQWGEMEITTAGVVTLRVDAGGGAFNAAGQKGLRICTTKYSIL